MEWITADGMPSVSGSSSAMFVSSGSSSTRSRRLLRLTNPSASFSTIRVIQPRSEPSPRYSNEPIEEKIFRKAS